MMSDKKVAEWLYGKPLDKDYELLKREAQAEITWPIASEHGFKVGIEQGKKEGRREVVEWIREKLNTITCMDDSADRDKAITSLIYELKEWGL